MIEILKSLALSSPTMGGEGDRLSSLGFFAAALASSVGIGNLWRFPYVALQYGGEFFIAYLLAVGVGLLLVWAEMRARGLHRILWLAAVTQAAIVSYYGPLTALTLSYAFPVGGPLLTLVVMAVAAYIVARGLRRGIEPFSKVSMALLFGLLAFLALQHPLQLPSIEWEGLLLPRLWVDALSQALFSLSAGMGIFYFYSRHAPIERPLPFVVGIGVGDTLAAFMGYHIVKAQGLGPGFLVGFEGLSAAMPPEVGMVFFSALFLAALSSLVSLMAVPASFSKRVLPLLVLLGLAVGALSLEEVVDALSTKLLLPLTASAIAVEAARERALGRLSPLLYAFPLLYAVAALSSYAG